MNATKLLATTALALTLAAPLMAQEHNCDSAVTCNNASVNKGDTTATQTVGDNLDNHYAQDSAFATGGASNVKIGDTIAQGGTGGNSTATGNTSSNNNASSAKNDLSNQQFGNSSALSGSNSNSGVTGSGNSDNSNANSNANSNSNTATGGAGGAGGSGGTASSGSVSGATGGSATGGNASSVSAGGSSASKSGVSGSGNSKSASKSSANNRNSNAQGQGQSSANTNNVDARNQSHYSATSNTIVSGDFIGGAGSTAPCTKVNGFSIGIMGGTAATLGARFDRESGNCIVAQRTGIIAQLGGADMALLYMAQNDPALQAVLVAQGKMVIAPGSHARGNPLGQSQMPRATIKTAAPVAPTPICAVKYGTTRTIVTNWPDRMACAKNLGF